MDLSADFIAPRRASGSPVLALRLQASCVKSPSLRDVTLKTVSRRPRLPICVAGEPADWARVVNLRAFRNGDAFSHSPLAGGREFNPARRASTAHSPSQEHDPAYAPLLPIGFRCCARALVKVHVTGSCVRPILAAGFTRFRLAPDDGVRLPRGGLAPGAVSNRIRPLVMNPSSSTMPYPASREWRRTIREPDEGSSFRWYQHRLGFELRISWRTDSPRSCLSAPNGCPRGYDGSTTPFSRVPGMIRRHRETGERICYFLYGYTARVRTA